MDPKDSIKSVEELKTRLAALAVGESVFWNPRVDPKIFALPPADVVQQVTEFSGSKKVKLRVVNK